MKNVSTLQKKFKGGVFFRHEFRNGKLECEGQSIGALFLAR